MSTETPAVMQIVSSDFDRVKLVGTFANTLPQALFEYWVRPDLLVKWWSQAAETEPQVGGSYYLSWPAMNWHLRGKYQIFEPGQNLTFSWKWEHEPETPEREVHLNFEEVDGTSTKLTIQHGYYNNTPKEQEERAGHIEGWQFFTGRLADILGPAK